MTGEVVRAGGLRRLFRRGPWEDAATAVIGLGVFMLMQPFVLACTRTPSWSFSSARSVS
jgi:hypothetical protein